MRSNYCRHYTQTTKTVSTEEETWLTELRTPEVCFIFYIFPLQGLKKVSNNRRIPVAVIAKLK